MLLLLAAAGVSASWLIGVRKFWLHLPVGLAVVTLLRTLTFSILNLIDQRFWLNPVFLVELFVILLWAAWAAKIQMYLSFWIAVGFATISVISTRIWGLSTAPKADSLWILSLTRLFNTTGDLNHLDRVTAIRRGFAYPLMLSLGPQTEYLSAFTPFTYLVLVSALIWAFKTLVTRNQHRAVLVAAALLFVLATAVMPVRIMFYIGPHALVAIGYTLAVVATATAIRDGQLSRLNLWVISLGFGLATVSSIEAIAVLSVISVGLLRLKWLPLAHARVIVLSTSVPFAIWLATYNSFIIQATGLTWYVFCAIFIGLSLIAVQSWRIRRSIYFWAPIAMAAFLISALIAYPASMTNGIIALLNNLFMGDGEWGSVAYVIVGSLALIVITNLRKASTELRYLLYVVTVGSIAQLVAKIIAGGQLGDPTLGRFAWTDSLNRMWFNILGLALIAVIVGISQQDWLWFRAKSNKLEVTEQTQ